MHKKFVLSYLIILIILLFSLSISGQASEKLRNRTISFFSPIWEKLLTVKSFISHPFASTEESEKLILQEEILRLRIENRLLKLKKKSREEPGLNALPARVIFRSFEQWNSTIWINAGEFENEKAGMKVIAKNSPVLVNEAVVGIIDFVGRHQSRVRLITDPTITPSVRAIRGGENDGLITDYINRILHAISSNYADTLPKEDNSALIDLLSRLRNTLRPFKKSWYLAKGELQGSLVPLGYAPPILKGKGFNYDFPDEEGPARDLRTGETDRSTNENALPILKVDDILITTGMDGIFPPGLQIATVTKIKNLKEGDYFYEIEAKPIADNLEELSLVFVIPPLGEFEEFTL